MVLMTLCCHAGDLAMLSTGLLADNDMDHFLQSPYFCTLLCHCPSVFGIKGGVCVTYTSVICECELNDMEYVSRRCSFTHSSKMSTC